MPCQKIGHKHDWNTTGTLVIERCENKCNFCEGDAKHHVWKFAWFLRRHVRSVHIKKGPYKNLTVSSKWGEDEVHAKKRASRKSKFRSRIKQEGEDSNDSDDSDEMDGFTIDPAKLQVMDDFIDDPELGQGVLLGDEYVSKDRYAQLIEPHDVMAMLDRQTRSQAKSYQQALSDSKHQQSNDVPVESIEKDDDAGFTPDILQDIASQFSVVYSDPLPADLVQQTSMPYIDPAHCGLGDDADGMAEGFLPDDLPTPLLPTTPVNQVDDCNAEHAGFFDHPAGDEDLVHSDSSFFDDEIYNSSPGSRFYLSDGDSSATSIYDGLPIASYNATKPPVPAQASVDALGFLAAAHDEMKEQNIDDDGIDQAFELFQHIHSEVQTPAFDPLSLPFGGPENPAGLWQSDVVILQ